MSDDEIIEGIRSPGKFDADVETREDAERLVRIALPDAEELPPAVEGEPYPPVPPGVDSWFQRHPAEPDVGNSQPHVKYADWSKGKKGRGGSWGHIFFPPSVADGE